MPQQFHPPVETSSIANIIALAWDDEVSFDMILRETGLSEPEVKALMRSTLKPGSYRVWRKRVSGRKKKHESRLHVDETKKRLLDPYSEIDI